MSEKSARSNVFTGGDPASIGRRSLRYSVGHTREQISRTKAWKRPPPRVTAGYLARYAERATSAATGAIVR